MQQQILLAVQGEFADHRSNHTQLICHAGNSREQVADPQATVTALAKFPGTAQPDSIRTRLRSLADSTLANRFPFVLFQHRLGIEGVDVTGATIHETENDVLGTWCVMLGE